MTSPYRFTREMYWPARADEMACGVTAGSSSAAEVMRSSCSALWKYMGK